MFGREFVHVFTPGFVRTDYVASVEVSVAWAEQVLLRGSVVYLRTFGIVVVV